MKKYAIHVTQRTALGLNQDAKTEVRAARWKMDDTLVITADPHFFRHVPDEAYEVVAVAEVIHPIIMSGTWQETISGFCECLRQRLRADGHIEINDSGTEFWRA